MRRLLALTLVVLAAPAAYAGVEVRVSGDRVDVQATNAPLAEILDGLSRQTQIKIVYEGPPPRQLLTVDLKDRTPAEALFAILEGQGLGFAVALDKTGTRVQTLLMAGPSSPSTGSSSAMKPGAPRPMPVPERRARESVVEEPLDDGTSEGEEPQLPPDTGRPDMLRPAPAAPPTKAGAAGAADAPAPSPGVFVPTPPVADYPTSVFAPKPPMPEQPKPKPESTPPPFNP